MELKKYKLGEIATVEISGVDKKIKVGETLVKLCNFVDVYYNWAITSEMGHDFMEATARANEIERFKLKKGQVALTKDSETRYDIGIATYIADDFDNVILGYHNALITPDPKKLSGKYLNALLHTDYARTYFANNASGSGQRYALSVDALNNFPVPVIPLAEQKRIGDIFSTIDRKISLNRAINCDLEAMAKQLYDYWFVQFDFPDENGKPYKSSGGKMVWNEILKREIPNGWKVLSIENVLAKYPTTKKFETREYLKEGNFPIIDQTTDKYIVGYTDDAENILYRIPAVLFGDHSTCVKFINTPFGRGADGTQILYSNNDRVSPYYLYLSVKNLKIPNPGYSRHFKYLKELPIVIPDDKISEKFDSLTTHLCQKWSNLIMESTNLQKFRDYLLPLLMNGQVTIKG